MVRNLKENKHTFAFKNGMRNLAKFHQSTFESLKIWTFIGSFYRKNKMYELKIYGGVMCHDNEEWCKIWTGIDWPVQNWHEEFDDFWLQHSKISIICTLMGCFWPNYIMFGLRKYEGVMFDGTQGWYKVWRKTDLCFQKWHDMIWGIWQIFTRASSKVQKLGLSLGRSIQNRKCMSLKFTGELCVMTMTNWCKIGSGIDLSVQN